MVAVLGLMAGLVAGQAAPPGPAGKEAKVSEKKWLDGGKGYQEALELQKLTGADILLYAAQYSPPEKRGLSTWFERKGLQHGRVVEAMKPYIKVKATLPLDKKDQPVFEKFRLTSGPALFVVRTNGWPARIAPFDWPGGEPELKTPDALVEELKAKSSPGSAPEAPPAGGP